MPKTAATGSRSSSSCRIAASGAGQKEAAATVAEIAAEVTRRKEETGQRPAADLRVPLQLQPLPRPAQRAGRIRLSGRMDDTRGPQAGRAAGGHLQRRPGRRRARGRLVRHVQQPQPLDDAVDAPRIRAAGRLPDELGRLKQPDRLARSLATGRPSALLYLRELGKIEKLRPYAVPSAEWVSKVATTFRQALPPAAPSAPHSPSPPVAEKPPEPPAPDHDSEPDFPVAE